MEIFFNELSILPVANSVDLARQKVTTLLETMKCLKEFDFNVLRTHDNFYGENLGSNYTFSSFINDPDASPVHKLLLRTIVKNPFLADEDSVEAEMFINNKFESVNHSGSTAIPDGIAFSFIHEVPTISLTGFPLWEEELLDLKIINTKENTISFEKVINISNPNSLKTNFQFNDWFKSITVEVQLNSYENIIKVFPTEKFEFEPRAINEMINWCYDDKRYLNRIIKLINNIRKAPFVGGIGLTENLGGGKGSKRIVKKDRVVYTVLEHKIIIHSCKKHYNDK